MTVEVVLASRLAAPRETVWSHVTTAHGINDELAPLLRMTVPAGLRGADVTTVPLDRPLGRAWVLLGGVVPVEYDDLRLVARDEWGFVERSRTGSARTWRHERWIDADPATSGCGLTDRVEVQPRRLVPAALAQRVVRLLFAHRHRRLRARFGGREVAPCPR